MLLRRTIPLPVQPPFAAHVDHFLIKAYTPASGATINSGVATVTASGGSGSYSFAWPASSGPIITNSPSSNATSWKYTGHGTASWDVESFTCAITDVGTGHIVYVAVSVDMQSGGAPH